MSVTLKRKVAISFQATVWQDGAVQATSAFHVDGDLYIKDGCTYLTFKEERAHQEEEIQTTLKWDETTLLLIRRGAVTMRQPFIDGQETCGRYVTAHMSCETKATTEQLAVEVPLSRGEHGHIHVRYGFWLQGQETGVHEICLRVMDREAERGGTCS
ncbi:DUF1934 domain-containing protein [Shouchella lonarensis]|uniref:Uncharacterized beta-barrel protein YwiB, DUF1934 family n=1 Tax=Shouchella lonarensis TaxID=1464122 RepID=A0A1G6GVS1_9BACI|nr:DUF1934 family protein [Shouchella lonarensis]SDB86150.1 Uncharacterized beta-barrel protein YwiB, DUF1934 family [Shouchella lonarensis]